MGWWGKVKKFGHKVWGGIKHAYHKVKKFWHKHGRKIKRVWHGVKRGLRFAANRGVPFTGAIATGMDRVEGYARRAKNAYNRFKTQTGMAGRRGFTGGSPATWSPSSRRVKKKRGITYPKRGPPGKPVKGVNSHAKKFYESKDLIRHSKNYKKHLKKTGIQPKLPYVAKTKPKTRKRSADINYPTNVKKRRTANFPVGRTAASFPVGY